MKLSAVPRPTALEWGMLAVGLVLTIHYAWILDDAYVYFRYVDNFVEYGMGWVYNEGEYVEGYTSPLWLMLLTVLRFSGLDYWLLVRGLGLLSFALFWWGLVLLDRDLAPAPAGGASGRPRVNLPLLFLAPNYGTLCYFTSGVEAPLVQLAAVAYALFLVRPERAIAGFVVALSPLIRPELALASLLALLFAWWRSGRPPVRVAALQAVMAGAWLAFRIYTYADLLPNTFYLKHEAHPLQGFAFLHQSLESYGVYALAVVAIGAVIALRGRAALDPSPRIAMLIVAAAIAAYFVSVGGDPRHHRYLAFSFCLMGASLAGLTEHALDAFWPGLRAGWVLAGSLALALLFASRYPPQLSKHPVHRDAVHLPVALINDAHFHRMRPGLSPPAWSLEALGHGQPASLLAERAAFTSGYRSFGSSLWCVDQYWRIHEGIVHEAGLTDAILARTPASSFRPAHKPALRNRARQLRRLRERYPREIGAFRRAIEDGEAPPWLGADIEAFERIERKIYNRHDWAENLRLALTPVPRITPAR